MVQLAVADLEGISACGLEGERGGVSYTIDSVRQLRSTEPERGFRLLLGSDAGGFEGSPGCSRCMDMPDPPVIAVVNMGGSMFPPVTPANLKTLRST